MKENKFFSRYLLVALALSTFPVTILYSSNFQNTNLVMYILPLAFVYLITLIFYTFLFLFFKNKNFKNVYLFSSVFSIWVFIYGIINEKLIGYNSDIINFLGTNRFLLPISLIILFLYSIFLIEELMKIFLNINLF